MPRLTYAARESNRPIGGRVMDGRAYDAESTPPGGEVSLCVPATRVEVNGNVIPVMVSQMLGVSKTSVDLTSLST